MATVKPIPDGYHAVTPYLIVKEGAKAIDFYKKALDATELYHMDGPDGSIMHAEIKIGNSILMLATENTQMKSKSPTTLSGTPVSFMVYVSDVDAAAKKAIAAGMTTLKPVENQFYGDRTGTFQDPFGHVWSLATHIEDVPPELLKKRAAELFAKNNPKN